MLQLLHAKMLVLEDARFFWDRMRKELETSSGDVSPVANRKKAFTSFGKYVDTIILTAGRD